eukprot:TRINITY_DN24764_c0_g1_i1.p1 TRINITY_DN24764_c0_g1~~TRINITY_DN24764_c0_g1_i1.p1  ORF type:complete len:192 (-),score=52.80 TRINITY_DN24764_c0_g1_i1:302-877(-)
MAFQRGHARLQSSPHYKKLEDFANDPTRLEMNFPYTVNSTVREDIRQICKQLAINFKCIGQGTQKRMIALKLDQIREKARADELVDGQAKGLVADFYKGVLKTLPPEHSSKVTALFVQHYAGERAWSLGEHLERVTDKMLAAKRRRLEDKGVEVPEEQGGGEDGADLGANDKESSSDGEDVAELLGRYTAM